MLENNPEIRLRFGDIAPIDLNRPARGGNQTRNNLEKRRFSAAARPQQGNQVSSLQIERNVLNRNEWGLPGALEGLMDVLEMSERNRGGVCPPLRIYLSVALNGVLPKA